MLLMTVEGTELSFLVDTGATYSTLKDTPDCATLSSSTVSVVGFSGIPMTLPLTDPALTQLGKQTLKHQYVVSPQVPVNLTGRDLLVKLGATIMCSADGLTVTLPGGKEFPCLGSPSKTQYLVKGSEQSTADIYWGRLVEEGILRTYQQWRPWIMSLAVYSEPRDPYHVTLFYDKEEDDTYREQFESDLEGETWNVKTHNIYIGPEGVAAAVKLTDEQLPWYNVGEDSAPHITLAVHVGHEARDLGPVVKRALDNSWWQEHKEISRTHGREKTDHPDAVAELPKLPDTLWSRGPTDMGLASCSPVLFELKSDAPINKPQYRHKPEADAGIAETIEGLLQGFALSPGIFNQVLKEALSPCQLPEGCTLIQYADDLLIAAPSVAACTAASLAVLNRLAECGFKVSKEKLQLVRPEVTADSSFRTTQAFTMTPLKQQRLSKILDAPNLTFTHEGINMADLMVSGEPHDCVKRAQVEEKVREDLKAEPIAGAEEWFTDGCCHRDEEGLKAGYAVVRRVGQEYQVIEAGRIEGQQSAQRAEVIALTRALRLAKNMKVNIYTDSAYEFGAAHVELAQWKRAGYRTATNAPICHKKEMEELEKALEDPDEVSIVKCKGHSQGDNPVARGNRKADEAAKRAAGYKGQRQMVQVTAEEEVSTNTLEEVRQAQKEAAPEEKGVWQAKGAWQEEGLWRSPDGRPVLTTKMAKQKTVKIQRETESNCCLQEVSAEAAATGSRRAWKAGQPMTGLEESERTALTKLPSFTPYELLTGRQFPAPWTVVSAEQPQKRNRSHAEYFNELKALVSSFTKQVTCEKPREKGEVPDAKAVWLKVIKRKWKEPRWTGPYEVTARTATAVQLKGKGDTWFHWTQCAAADESLVDEDPAPPNTGGNDSKRQNKSSPLCNGPTGSLPGRPKKEEQPRRKSPRLQKGGTTD
ncbi:F-box and leucine-rich repeat protein 13 [Sarotherodon galilaeus]